MTSPKGGVGKSTIAKELATMYSLMKYNDKEIKVCLVDCDVEYGDIGSMLGLSTFPNIVGWSEDIKIKLNDKVNWYKKICYRHGEIEKYAQNVFLEQDQLRNYCVSIMYQYMINQDSN